MVKASLHLDHVPADLEIMMDIVRGGVVFDPPGENVVGVSLDSELRVMTITADAFDEMGQLHLLHAHGWSRRRRTLPRNQIQTGRRHHRAVTT